MFTRSWRRLILAVVLLASLLVPSATLANSALDWDVAGGHFYKQANGHSGAGDLGYPIVDNGQARFWSEFQRLGGVSSLGYPCSQRFTWDGFTVQATQRVVLQWRPDIGQAYFVNVFDRLHELGGDQYLHDVRQVPYIADWSSDVGKPWDQVVAAHLALLDANPSIKAHYMAAAQDPVGVNGLPMAPIADMGNVYVLRAQRIVVQQWKQNEPWAVAGQVTLALGGDIATLTDWAGKLVGHVARIAGLMHAAKYPAGGAPWAIAIEESTVQNAVRIGHYLIAHARASFAEMGADPEVENARRVLRWIAAQGAQTFSKRDAFNGTRGHFKRVESMEPALATLVAHDYIRQREPELRPGRGRKPSPAYDVNPAALKEMEG